MNNSFELQIKDKLSWTFRQWKEAGEEEIKTKRLVNSLKYWYGRLRSAMKEENVVFTLYNSVEKAYPKLQQIVQSLKALDNKILIKGYAKFRNRRFISVTFEDVATKTFVAENLKVIGDSQIAYLHWIEESQKTKIVIDWLSNHTDLDLVCDYVSQYLNISSAYKVNTVLEDGTTYLSGKVEVSGDLRENISIDEIPHIDYIDGLECSINIEGRPFKCHNCLRLGHKSSQCTKAFCKICRKMLGKNHECLRLVDKGTDISVFGLSNGLSLHKQSVGLLEKNNSCSAVQSLEKDNIAKLNLFWNSGLKVQGQEQQEEDKAVDKHWPMDYNCQQEDAFSLSRVNKEVKKESVSFNNSFALNKNENLVYNEYVVEDVKSNDSNFILIDTSSSESDGDMNDDQFNIQDRSSWGIEDAPVSIDFSRSLVQESGYSIDMLNLKESKLINEGKIKDLELKLQEEGFKNVELLGTKPKIFQMNSQVKRKNGKKKRKAKR